MPPFDLDRYQTLHAASSGGVVGANVRYREQTASTMDDARAGADAGADVGTVYVAGEQTAGRGRQRRTWLSQPGGGLATIEQAAYGEITWICGSQEKSGSPTGVGLGTIERAASGEIMRIYGNRG